MSNVPFRMPHWPGVHTSLLAVVSQVATYNYLRRVCPVATGGVRLGGGPHDAASLVAAQGELRAVLLDTVDTLLRAHAQEGGGHEALTQTLLSLPALRLPSACPLARAQAELQQGSQDSQDSTTGINIDVSTSTLAHWLAAATSVLLQQCTLQATHDSMLTRIQDSVPHVLLLRLLQAWCDASIGTTGGMSQLLLNAASPEVATALIDQVRPASQVHSDAT